jgi:pilus assembly protein Flp/PilA
LAGAPLSGAAVAGPWGLLPAGTKVLYWIKIIVHFFSSFEAFMFISFPRGQGLVEYALLLALVSIILVVILLLFGSSIGNLFSNVIANI